MCKSSNGAVGRRSNLSTLSSTTCSLAGEPGGRSATKVDGPEERQTSLLLRVPGLKDPVAERPNHSNFCTSEFRENSVRIQEFFSQFFRNSENVETYQHFLEYSAKSGEKIIKISANFDENY